MKYLIIVILFLSSSSCIRSNIFEKNIAVKNHSWDSKSMPTFAFAVTDTVSDYSMYFNIRHSDAYLYSNIWLEISTKFPEADTSIRSKIEVPLADLDGKWLGRGMNEIWEHRMLIASPLHFSKSGNYEVALKQIMRVNPLPHIMSVGIRLEKIQK